MTRQNARSRTWVASILCVAVNAGGADGLVPGGEFRHEGVLDVVFAFGGFAGSVMSLRAPCLSLVVSAWMLMVGSAAIAA